MNEIKVFDNQDFGQVRIVMDGDKVLFCGTDVARALGYTVQRMLSRLIAKGSAFYRPLLTAGFNK